MITLHNTSRSVPEEVYAADGDSVLLPPGSTHTADDKFLWKLPKSVIVVGEKVVAKEAPPVSFATNTDEASDTNE